VPCHKWLQVCIQHTDTQPLLRIGRGSHRDLQHWKHMPLQRCVQLGLCYHTGLQAAGIQQPPACCCKAKGQFRSGPPVIWAQGLGQQLPAGLKGQVGVDEDLGGQEEGQWLVPTGPA
jgi:hypothetical protein